MDYIGILTNHGRDVIEQAIASGTTVTIAGIAYGDGAGSAYTPIPTQTRLRRQVGLLTAVDRTTENGWIYFSGTIPATEQTFTLREIGIVDANGDLLAVANTPEAVKPLSSQGAYVSLPISLALTTSQGSVIIVEVSPGDEFATRTFVLDAIASIKVIDGGTF